MGGLLAGPRAAPPREPPRVIGLTGGIGSGKTTAAKILASLGAHVVDADRIGHECYAAGTAGWRRVVRAFGEQIVAPDGSIDRRRLASIVFADTERLRQLNRIVHPLIARRIAQLAARWRRRRHQPPLVIEAAVLLEAGWDRLVDEVWVIRAPRREALERASRDRGLPPAEVSRRMRSQLPDAERRRRAHAVIDNSGPIEALERRLRRLWARRGLSSTSPAG